MEVTFLATQDQATQDKARQGPVLRQPDETRRVSLVLKNTVYELINQHYV